MDLNETYHTASHASFPDNMAAKAKSGVPKIQRLRVHGMKALSGLQCPRVRGIKGSWVPVDPKVSEVPRA